MGGSLPGLATYSSPNPAERSSFRSSTFIPEGGVGAHILEGQVVDLNLVNWTVDVKAKHDQKVFLNIQMSSPYMHFNRGEGIYVMPDIGAKCHVCIPSDGPPPYLLDFIMPQETINGASADAPAGTDGSKAGTPQETTAASFAGGRRRAKPGDILIVNRDGSFVRLHRGGVLQIGASELSQRIYVSLQNVVTDISQNYRHLNTGGSINWFVASGDSSSNPPTVSRHTYRLLANDQKATVRVAIGKVTDVITEPDEQTRSDLTQLGVGADPVVCEVLLAPGEVSADDGSLTDATRGASLLRYFFDAKGNVLLRTTGNVVGRVGKRLRLRVDGDVELFGGGAVNMTFDKTGRFQATNGLDVNGKVIRFNGGSKPIATVGSIVTMTVVAPIPIVVVVAGVPSPGVISIGAIFTGVVSTGNPTLLG